eukprot:9421578-Pyramimonas_sp.AAC.1
MDCTDWLCQRTPPTGGANRLHRLVGLIGAVLIGCTDGLHRLVGPTDYTNWLRRQTAPIGRADGGLYRWGLY